MYTSPRFVAKDGDGKVIDEKTWADGEALGHEGALDHLVGSPALTIFRASPRRPSATASCTAGSSTRSRCGSTRKVVDALEKYVPLAPLHQPHNLAPIRLLLARRPDLPQVACFDTAFHRGQPPVAQAFALPRAITDRGVLRYGFHGLSYEYIAQALAEVRRRAPPRARSWCCISATAPACARWTGGRSVASTMGFTAADGLPMGTRCGSLDPGVVLYLMDELGMDARAIEKPDLPAIGTARRVRHLERHAHAARPATIRGAKAAIDLFVYRIGRELGSLAAALGGLDAIVFTAGIGEHSAALRERVCRDAAWLGVELDADANARNATRISTPASRVSAWVIPTNEELMIAMHTQYRAGVVSSRAPCARYRWRRPSP